MPRLLKHLGGFLFLHRRRFPPRTLRAIAAAVRASETKHGGEIRVALEAALPLVALLRGVSPRARAVQVFARLGVGDTVHRNGALLYVSLADRAVEIVADTGLNGKVRPEEWASVCRLLENKFREGKFEEGVLEGLAGMTALLARHDSAPPGKPNELPDLPTIL